MRKPFLKLLSRWLGSPNLHRTPRSPLWSLWRRNQQKRFDKVRENELYRSKRRSAPNLRPCHVPGSEGSSSARFNYGRLNWAGNEIRLIRLLPDDPDTPTDGNFPIACEMISVSLNEKPRYIALSYAWEDTTLSHPVLLNGKVFHATASLDAALRQIRKLQVHDSAYRNQYFWIDALCINQEDEIEKSWQVQRMNHIFQEAQYALVWLGPASRDSDKAMQALEHVGLNVASGTDPYDNKTLSTFNLLASLYNEFSASVKSLLLRSWWRRIWVVQEFASAQDVKFLCGDVQISWQPCFTALEALEKFQRALAEKGWNQPRGDIATSNLQHLMTDISAITGILRLFRIRRALRSSQKRLPLWELLTLKRFGMLSSDNRDFVYALTGIAEDAASKHLYPDYTKHAASVYTEVAKCFLAEGRLRTLWLCSHPRHLPGLPSWVPDWSSAWDSDRRYLSADAGYGSGNRIFSAAGDSAPGVSFSARDGRMLLHLEGIRVDTVKATKSPFDMQSVLNRGGILRAHLALQGRFRALSELQRGRDTVWRTAITDIEPVWGADLHFNYRRSTPKMRRELYAALATATDEGSTSQMSWRLPASRLDILYRHNGRRPFLTEGGRLGLGPGKMRDGDVVVVVCGAEVPLVLRPVTADGVVKESLFELVGEAYVNGIMDGEAMRLGLEMTTFDLV